MVELETQTRQKELEARFLKAVEGRIYPEGVVFDPEKGTDIFDYQCCRCRTLTKNVKVKRGGFLPSWTCGDVEDWPWQQVIPGREDCGGQSQIVREKRKDIKGKWHTRKFEFIPELVEEHKEPLVITEQDFERMVALFEDHIIVSVPDELQDIRLRDTLNLITHGLKDRLGKKILVREDGMAWTVEPEKERHKLNPFGIEEVPNLTDEEIEQYFDENWNIINKPPAHQKLYNAVCEERKRRMV